MNVSRRILLLLAIIILVLLLFYLFVLDGKTEKARWLDFKEGATAGALPAVEVLKADVEGMEIRYRFPGLWAKDVELGNQHFSHIYAEGYGFPLMYGLPELPLLRKKMIIPHGAKVDVEIVEANYKEYDLTDLGLKRLSPFQHPKMKTEELQQPFAYEVEFYQKDGFYPSQPISIESESRVRGRWVFTASASPVAYNPAIGRLRFYTDLTLRFNFTDADIDRSRADWIDHYSPEFEGWLNEHTMNYWSVFDQLNIRSSDIYTQLRMNYLIILGDDSFEAPMQPFVNLKQNEHYTVTMLRLSDLIPNAASLTELEIKNQLLQEIIAIYQTDNKPSFLLLVGDRSKIPAWVNDERPGQENTPHYLNTDLFYATMDAPPDVKPDIRYGRLPVETATELGWIVDKFVNYASLSGNETWLKKASFIATCDAGHYLDVEQTHNVAMSRTAPRGYVGNFPVPLSEGGDRLFCISNNADENDVKAMLSEGRGYVVYSGHGSSREWQDYSFENDEVEPNVPSGVFPFVNSYACYTGMYSYPGNPFPLAKAWMNQQNKGAIGYYGPSYSSGWDTDNAVEHGTFEAAFPLSPYGLSGYRKIPSRLAEAGMVSLEALRGEAYTDAYRQMYNLFGDPSTLLWFQGWSLILNPNLPELDLENLIFFDANTQELHLYVSDAGDLRPVWNLRLENTNWQQAAFGNFDAEPGDELVMLEPHTGHAGIYKLGNFDDQPIKLIVDQDDLITNWSEVVSGQMGTQGSDSDFLFLYDSKQGNNALYFLADKKLLQQTQTQGLPAGFDLLVSGNLLANNTASEILFYDSEQGRAELYAVNEQGLQRQGIYNGLEKTWDQVVIGDFTQAYPQQELLAYDKELGIAKLYAVESDKKLRLLERYTHLGANWDQLVSVDLNRDQRNDLMLYRHMRGEGSIYLMDDAGKLVTTKRTPLTLEDVPKSMYK
jgi:hypothetical protein